jgi:hypothetical protein
MRFYTEWSDHSIRAVCVIPFRLLLTPDDGDAKLAPLTGGVSSELRKAVVLVLDTGNFGVADVWTVLTKTQFILVWSVYFVWTRPAQRRTCLDHARRRCH